MKKKQEKKKREKKRGKKGKEGPKKRGTEMGPKNDSYIRIVKRNRNEIEGQKKSDFEHPTKTKKMNENERK